MSNKYIMTQEQFDAILAASQPVPYMVFGGIEPTSPQEKANAAWKRLGDEMGFDHMTVQPAGSKFEFYAEPRQP